MPLNIINQVIQEGFESIPHYSNIIKYGPFIGGVALLKYYTRGSSNTWERNLHGKVYIITGATSGVGLETAFDLANRGAQLILLVRKNDQWTMDFIDDMRSRTNNDLIYTEEVDFSLLYSVRKFATKWLDSAPPRRLDGIIFCHGECASATSLRTLTEEGLESQVCVNYVGPAHMLDLLRPSLKIQPPDRDVRIVYLGCTLQSLGVAEVSDPLHLDKKFDKSIRWFADAKFQMGLFMMELQRRCLEGDNLHNISCTVVNPGVMRSTSTRRLLTFGTVFGLLLYLILYPLWWLLLKSGLRGAQSVLHTVMSPEYEGLKTDNYCNYVVECKHIKWPRKEHANEQLQKELYDTTVSQITEFEKRCAKERAMKKKASGAAEKGTTKTSGTINSANDTSTKRRKSKKA